MAEWIAAFTTLALIVQWFLTRHLRQRERTYLTKFRALEEELAYALAAGDITAVNHVAARLRDLRTTYHVLAR